MSEIVTAGARRIVNASCDKVWHAETDPQYFEQWFGAKAGSVKSDVRTGGGWRAIVAPRGGPEIELEGSYVEVVPQRRLVMTIPAGPDFVEVTIVLTDLDGRTEIASSTPVPAEAKEQVEATAAEILAAVAGIAESL